MSPQQPEKSWFKNEITLGQVLAIGIPLFLAIISYWVSTMLNNATRETEIMLLKNEVANLKDETDKQKTYQIQSFGEIQKTLTAIQINLVNKKDRDEKR
jgi:hypothetical protein